VRLSVPQAQDSQYQATFPAFSVWNRGNDLNGLGNLHSSETRLPANNFRTTGGGNTSRYMNADFDALLETYFRTVPLPERIHVLGQVIRHMAEQITVVGLYYNAVPGAISDRLIGVSKEWPGSYITWNAYEWDVRS
jgi:ABC-type transport system substrate-binding protein